MSNERCTNCVGDRNIECDSIREDIASKLTMLMGFPNLCHGFGFSQPACVTEAASALSRIGCAIPTHVLAEELNPEGIS